MYSPQSYLSRHGTDFIPGGFRNHLGSSFRGDGYVTFMHDELPWLTTFTVIQEGKAASVLARYHSLTGDERDPLIMFEMAQIRHALKLEKETAKNTSFTTLFSTPGNRKRMTIIVALAIFSQWRSVIFQRALGADAYMHTTPVEMV